jgi:hypothetical protein
LPQASGCKVTVPVTRAALSRSRRAAACRPGPARPGTSRPGRPAALPGPWHRDGDRRRRAAGVMVTITVTLRVRVTGSLGRPRPWGRAAAAAGRGPDRGRGKPWPSRWPRPAELGVTVLRIRSSELSSESESGSCHNVPASAQRLVSNDDLTDSRRVGT